MYRIPECTEYQSVTVDSFRLYPRVLSEESDIEPDMEETGATGGNHPLTEFQIQIKRQKLELMKLEYQSETVDSFGLYRRITREDRIQNRIWRKPDQQANTIHSQSFKFKSKGKSWS